jgi:prolyl 4-hydroxylase
MAIYQRKHSIPAVLCGQDSVSSATNRVLFIDGFLSERQCHQILEELDFAFWRPSLTYQKQRDGNYLNRLTSFRVSTTAHQEWFSKKLNSILVSIEKRLQRLFRIDPLHLEPWQATDYRRHGKFDYHLDSGYWENHYAGERILTFLLYLRTPIGGGGTHFRALDTYVHARAGRLLVWNNLFPDGSCDYRMIHSSMPLLKGRKTTLVTWQREKRYRIIK